jgi:glycosyltransferase involved in cell wall biosynthesis
VLARIAELDNLRRHSDADVESSSQSTTSFFPNEIALSRALPCALLGEVPRAEKMKVSIVIPCYNEKNTIEKIVEAVRSARIESREIIVVDDCSQDGTRALLEERLSQMVDRIIYHPANRGKGAALRSGFAAATGDIILVQDADLEYNPEDYAVLLEPLMSGKADAVFGSRFIGGGPHRALFFWHMAGNRFLTLLSNMFTNLNLTDIETGYKAFKASLIKSIQIEEDRFGVEPEIIAKLARTGCRIYEVGISYSGRTYAEGKKVNWKDGVKAIYAILKYNLSGGQRSEIRSQKSQKSATDHDH